MKKEIITYKIECDICNAELEKSFVSIDKYDLCRKCTGSLFIQNLMNKVPDEKILEWIRNVKDLNTDEGVDIKSSISPIDSLSSLDNITLSIPDKKESSLSKVSTLDDL